MPNIRVILIPAVVLAITATAFPKQAGQAGESGFGYGDYAVVLKKYVDANGMVNYKELKKDRGRLDAFVGSMATLKRKSYDKWKDEDKIAFWLNAYNGFTLKAIIDNYPIKSSFLMSRVYPKNSIRQIKGVWTKLKFNVMGNKLSLKHIEHEILRKEFDDPRIHVAMVCAAMGCPPLRNEPYEGKKLDVQLDDQSRKFLSDPLKFRVGKSGLQLSPIFKWFGEDFIKTYGSEKPYAGYEGKEGAVLKFIVKYLKEDQKKWLKYKQRQEIEYQGYDWTLNEQQAKDKPDTKKTK
jgi:hypothetical protein